MRKLLIFLTMGFVIGISSFLFFWIVHKNSEIKDLFETKQSILWFKEEITQYQPINFSSEIPVVLIFYNPECDFCQQQAESFQSQSNLLEGIQWFWISDANPGFIDQFIEKYGLHQISDVYFIKDSSQSIIEKAGISTIPHILIYNRRGELVKEYKGETKLESILKSLE